MKPLDFDTAFKALTGNAPFPWQCALYNEWLAKGKIPASCNLPTGLGKTSVIAVWLIALANGCAVPRRLVYVVNRRTVVDQTTDEVEKYKRNLEAAGIKEQLALSTLRGQFADNREWSADPSRPAVICGTVDMIGSRLLFSGYGCGFKSRPLHAGFLGQDSLLVHDEAHLEPAFQKLIEEIEKEQKRCNDFRPMRVMELTATSRGEGEVFGLTDEDKKNSVVQQRIGAKKTLHLHENKDEKKLADEIAEVALKYKDSGQAILVFVRRVDDVAKIVTKLKKEKQQVQQLTGALRGLERDSLPTDSIFARFLPESNRPAGVELAKGTVYLVCTSAGEVGVNISADHLVCDLSTFESMAQRFGRVNRFGERTDTEIHVVYPKEFDAKGVVDVRLKLTLGLLELLNGDASPSALTALREKAIKEGSNTELISSDHVQALRDYVNANQGTDPRLGAFAPPPILLPTSDILFDVWALTTIREKLSGRPPVEQYLHGIAGWEPPETHVAWRQEVWELRLRFASEDERKQREATERKRLAKCAEELLEYYPLKPHELLRDRSDRVFKHLAVIAARHPDEYAWLIDDEGSVEIVKLKELADKDKKERLNGQTVLLPPSAGGLEGGFLSGDSPHADDVADEWYANDAMTVHRRLRVWDDDDVPDGMRRILTIDTKPNADEADEESTGRRFWHWYELRLGGDDEGIQNSKKPVLWQVHTSDVVRNTIAIVERLLPANLRELFTIAAKYHDLGKKRKLFQTVLGNRHYPKVELAKSGKYAGRVEERYRHEFGSLLDIQAEPAFIAIPDDDLKALVLHVIAAHHGRARPHFAADEAFDPEAKGRDVNAIVREVPQRFARLQRKYGRWGLAYLESLLRAADYAASACPSEFVEDQE
jgi:CRISPR-associated endonuclease/helicase Cas3